MRSTVGRSCEDPPRGSERFGIMPDGSRTSHIPHVVSHGKAWSSGSPRVTTDGTGVDDNAGPDRTASAANNSSSFSLGLPRGPCTLDACMNRIERHGSSCTVEVTT